MDKAKLALAMTRKYHFWALCVCILLSAPVCWWFAANSLADQCNTHKGALRSLFTSLTGFTVVPNQSCVDAIRKKEEELKKEVYNAWNVLYIEQKKNNPLPPELTDEFKKAYDAIPTVGGLPENWREYYRAWVQFQFPDLRITGDIRRPEVTPADKAAGDRPSADGEKKAAPAAAANPVPPARQTPALARGFGANRGPRRDAPALPANRLPEGPQVKWIGTVEWSNGQYEAIKASYQWSQTPSTLRVVLAQEDLWVYEALLRAIKKTNERPGGPIIKKIISLEIGAAAVKSWRESVSLVFKGSAKPQAEASTLAEGEQQRSSMLFTRRPLQASRSSGPAGPAGAAAAPGAAPTVEMDTHPADRNLMLDRYVNDNGNALPVNADPPYEVPHPYAEFKMMPICMDFMMDQRKLPTLLAECANSSMPIEVRRVRIHQTTGVPLDLASLQPSAAGPAAAAPAARGERSERGERSGSFAAALQGQTPHSGLGPAFGPGRPLAGPADSLDFNPNDIPVEVQGIIYIYNPPNEKKLGTGWEAEKGKELAAQGETTPDASAAGESATQAKPNAEPPAGAPASPAAATPSKPADSAAPPTEAVKAAAAKAEDTGPGKAAPGKNGAGP